MEYEEIQARMRRIQAIVSRRNDDGTWSWAARAVGSDKYTEWLNDPTKAVDAALGIVQEVKRRPLVTQRKIFGD
jgi:hypothetical protein